MPATPATLEPISHIAIIIPVFNDWPSFQILLEKLNTVAATLGPRLTVLAVNDGSIETFTPPPTLLPSLTSLAGAEIIHLALNLGHQRAIAVGLCAAVESDRYDALIVMDGDGEDPPESIPTLLQHAAGKQNFCIVAQRRKRTETLSFKLSYRVYKFLFGLVTGREINFGNFSLTSRGYARRIVMISDLWNNLAAALLRSRLPIQRVPVDRGHRYAGTSKMNFVSLVIHGLSGISVYAEIIFVRLLLFTLITAGVTFVAIAFVAFLRFFYPSHATPGWATTVSFSMIIILTQVCFTTISSILILLNSRVVRLIVPRSEFQHYIESREQLLT